MLSRCLSRLTAAVDRESVSRPVEWAGIVHRASSCAAADGERLRKKAAVAESVMPKASQASRRRLASRLRTDLAGGAPPPERDKCLGITRGVTEAAAVTAAAVKEEVLMSIYDLKKAVSCCVTAWVALLGWTRRGLAKAR